MRSSLRGILLGTLIAGSLFVKAYGRACAAEVEFCPGSVNAFHEFRGSNDGLIAFYVAAESARSVSANVIVQSESNWYTFQFKDAAILPDLAHFESPTVRFDRMLYHSKPLYVRLPPGEQILRWWIYDAITTGDSGFGWEKQGDVTCSPPPESVTLINAATDVAKRVNPPNDLFQLPAAGDTILAAAKIPQPAEMTECAKPFVAATVIHAFQPVWPRSVPRLSAAVVSEIEVAVAANGRLAGAWIYRPSGYPDLDLEALKAAKLSRYRGGISLCKPAPGTYLFRADFEPN